MNKRIAAVVVTYNRLELLKKCIFALEKQQYPCDILIVDNASADSTQQWATEYTAASNTAIYFNTGENLGGAGGFNYGMRKAVEMGYEYVWIMDDDCITFPDTLAKLMEADTVLGGSSNYGFLSSQVLWTDGSLCLMNRQKFKKQTVKNDYYLEKGLKAVTQATFVSLLFPALTIKKAGLPIKEFFIWGDDVEYTRRIAVRMDNPSYLVENSTVVHEMAINRGSNIALDVPQRIDRYRYAFRNENYLYRKEGIKGVCYYVAKCGFNLLKIIFKAKNHRMKRCGVIIKCMFGGLFFNPAMEHID